MRHGRSTFRAFAFSLTAALWLVALGASTAQAQNLDPSKEEVQHGAFTILGETIAKSETVSASADGSGVFTVKDFNFEVTCKATQIVEMKLDPGGKGGATIKFSECTVWSISSKEELKPCSEALNAKGGISTKVKFLLIRHEEEVYLLASPQEGLIFTVIYFGGKCVLPVENEIRGSISALVEPKAVTQKINLDSASKGGAVIQTLLGGGLTYGVHIVTLQVEILGKLSGEKTGCSWGAI